MINILLEKDLEKEAIIDYIKTLDFNDVGVSISTSKAEWFLIQQNRNDIPKESVIRCLPSGSVRLQWFPGMFTFEEFLQHTTSEAIYSILSTRTSEEVKYAIQYYKENHKLDTEDILCNTKYLPYDIILEYFNIIKTSEDALKSMCSNLYVPNEFFIGHKELFWEYRWELGRRILDDEFCKIFKLVPYRCIPEEYKRFQVIETGYDNEMTTKEAIKALQNETLPLYDFLD